MQKRLHIPSIGMALASFFAVIMLGLSPRPIMESQTREKILTAEKQDRYSNAVNLLGELINLEPWRIDLWMQRGRFGFEGWSAGNHH